jgi:hypothetical protein
MERISSKFAQYTGIVMAAIFVTILGGAMWLYPGVIVAAFLLFAIGLLWLYASFYTVEVDTRIIVVTRRGFRKQYKLSQLVNARRTFYQWHAVEFNDGKQYRFLLGMFDYMAVQDIKQHIIDRASRD